MVVGAVLAAGLGTRMGRPKGALVVHGARLVDRAVAALRAGGCDRVIAVVRDSVDVPGATIAVNAEPERGLRSSLALAIDAAAGAEVLVVVLADQPGVGADAIAGVLAGWRPGRIAVGRFGERSGHPIAMSPERWRAALAMAGADEGARRYLAAHPDLIDEIEIAGDPADLDTPADLRSWSKVADTPGRGNPG